MVEQFLITKYKPVKYEGSRDLAWFTNVLYSVNNYLDALSVDDPDSYTPFKRLHEVSSKSSPDNLEDSEAKVFEDMLDAIDVYIMRMSGNNLYKLKVQISSALIFYQECVSGLKRHEAYVRQEVYNDEIRAVLRGRSKMSKKERNHFLKQKAYMRRTIGKQAAEPFNELMAILKEHGDVNMGDAKSFCNFIKNTLFVKITKDD